MLKSKEEISAACGELIASRPFFDPVRLAIAKNNGLRYFDDYCDRHGVTAFRVKDGACAKCREDLASPRVVARRSGKPFFMGRCAKHGETKHGVTHGRCLTCFTTSGARRVGPRLSPKPPERVAAEVTGSRSYVAACALHGPTQFWTHSGHCMACRTVAGKPRRPQGPSSARAISRKHGLTQYRGHCGVHGWTAHSVGPGKCLTCFNAMGYPRPGLTDR